MIRVRACTLRCRCHSSCRRSRFSQLGTHYISFKDADGRRRKRKVEAPNNELAKLARSAEQIRPEQSRALGFTPPGNETFADVAQQYLAHQKARISPANYERERGIVEDHI